MIRLGLLLCSFIMLLFCNVYGQNEQIRFGHLSTEHGLSQNSGRSIKQDKYGFIWIATESGVNRYDGRTFSVLRHDPDNHNSLTNNYVNTIETGKSNNLYIGTDGSGLNIYNIITDSFKVINSKSKILKISNDFVYSLFEDKNNNVWIGTGNGLFYYNISKNSVLTIIAPIKNEKIYIRSIIEIDNQNLLVASSKGLFVVNKVNLTSQRIKMSPKTINSIICLKNNIILAGGNDGVYFYKNFNGTLGSELQNPILFKRIAGKTINSLLEDNVSNHLYIGTNDSGLFQIDFNKGAINKYTHNSQLPLSISSPDIKSLFLDNTGILWIGTYFNGINFINTKRKKFLPVIPSNNGILLSSITSICKDNEGHIWMGSTNGLYKHNLTNNKVENFPTGKKPAIGPLNSMITALLPDTKGSIWIATDGGGLSVVKNNKFKITSQ